MRPREQRVAGERSSAPEQFANGAPMHGATKNAGASSKLRALAISCASRGERDAKWDCRASYVAGALTVRRSTSGADAARVNAVVWQLAATREFAPYLSRGSCRQLVMHHAGSSSAFWRDARKCLGRHNWSFLSGSGADCVADSRCQDELAADQSRESFVRSGRRSPGTEIDDALGRRPLVRRATGR
jgi:hypothetical protein